MRRFFCALLLLTLLLNGHKSIAAAQEPVVHAVLFYATDCPHCRKVMKESLPPIKKEFGAQLDIIGIDVMHPLGQSIYQAMLVAYEVPTPRIGVPTMIVGDKILIGEQDIPLMLPDIVRAGINAGGVDWPDLPGLDAVVGAQATLPPENSAETNLTPPAASDGSPAPEGVPTANASVIQTIQKDPLANSIAILVLLLMIFLILYVLARFMVNRTDRIMHWPAWSIPVISIFGLGVAAYLSFVEVTQTEAICGPVGNCNTVQSSPYAILFGVLPVGVLGIMGYLAILGGWLLKQFGPRSTRNLAIIALWAFAWIGILFSIYLTFLEPFVIGATCAWCITSAILMSMIFLATSGPAIQVFDYNE